MCRWSPLARTIAAGQRLGLQKSDSKLSSRVLGLLVRSEVSSLTAGQLCDLVSARGQIAANVLCLVKNQCAAWPGAITFMKPSTHK